MPDLRTTERRILAQLAEQGSPVSATTIEEALQLEPGEATALLGQLRRTGHVAPLVSPRRRIGGRAFPALTFYELTEAGAIIAEHGASQLTIDGRSYRPPVAVQPALF